MRISNGLKTWKKKENVISLLVAILGKMSQIKRLKRKIKSCPNPLFESWLKEWRDEAKRNGSEMHYCFGRALKSLQKYPFRLETGKECFILENFGAKLCMMLDKKLTELHLSGESIAAVKSVSTELRRNDYKSCTSSNEVLITDRVSTDSVNDIPTRVNELEVSRSELVQKRKSCMDSPIRNLKNQRKDNGSYQSKLKKTNRRVTYLPGYRSGGYAILLTLHKYAKEMTKAELEIEAQKFCDAPFRKSSDSHYTAWSSMSTLVKKGLVEKTGRPPRFSLTAEGIAVVAQLQSSEDENDSIGISSNELQQTNEEYPNFNLSISIDSSFKESSNNIDSLINKNTIKKKSQIINNNGKTETVQKSEMKSKECRSTREKCTGDNQSKEETFFLLPNEFDVVLYVDNKEIENKQDVETDKIARYLKRRNVKFEFKNLNVGDYLWICRDRKINRELVLPYVVERKRMDDLASSVKDGRFHEQKFRLKNCGLSRCIYLVEKYGNESTRLGLPLPTIQQAVSNTRVLDGFDVKITNNNEESLRYLSLMTSYLTKMFQDKTLVSCNKANLPIFKLSDDLISLMPFTEFNKDAIKMRKFTVRNMLVKHLLQLNGMSVERARAIVRVYPTPKSLIEALQSPEWESTFANITCGALNRSIGSNLARSLQQLYTLPKLN